MWTGRAWNRYRNLDKIHIFLRLHLPNQECSPLLQFFSREQALVRMSKWEGSSIHMPGFCLILHKNGSKESAKRRVLSRYICDGERARE